MQVSLNELFGYRYIKRFYFARFISNFGNGMAPIALAFGILHLPNGDANLLGLVLGATTVAMLVMSPFGGVLADKFGRIRAVAFADLVGATGLFVQVANRKRSNNCSFNCQYKFWFDVGDLLARDVWSLARASSR
jgi:MFS family permease